jgi:intracellular multiplication protein IcmE
MNGRLKNLTGLFRNTRTRTIIIFTGAILVFAIVIGLFRLAGQSGPTTTASVGGAPDVQSVPGGFEKPETPEYARLQQEQNVQQAKIALQQGTSEIPTIINASNIGQQYQQNQPCCNPCPCTGGATATGAGLPLAQASALKPGTLVYDANGKVIGTVGPDGKVRDANGNVIGTVGPDGLVRDVNGNVIGGAAATAAGTPVYDAQGHLIGTVGPDGKVRDAKGNVIGTVSADGVVRDLNGNIIGKAGVPPGTPAYDAKNNLLGTTNSDAKVKDASCKVIGTVGADAIVRDLSGKIIGKTGEPLNRGVGTPIYDLQGKFIAVVGADGKAHDISSCQIIGTVQPDGTVLDNNGKLIGKAGAVVPGTPVYDAQGKLIGVVGADGKVRDANGNVVGTVGADGLVRDASGKVIGKVGPTIQGTPVYDAQGHLIGVVGPDGKVRDANGKVIGTVGLDGVVRDANGNVIGNVSPLNGGTNAGGTAQPLTGPLSISAVPSTQSSALQQAMQRQTAIVSQQKAEQLQTQMQGAMSAQANQLLAAWAAPVQQYVPGNPAVAQTAQQQAEAAAAASAAAAQAVPVVKAGTIMFAVLTTSINSDQPGPVLAKIIDGKFRGGTLLGGLTNQGESVMLTFNTLTLPNVSRSVSISTVAVDPNTARTALSSYTNDHYLLRYGTLFASSFLQGYAQALTQSGQQTISNGLITLTTHPDLSSSGKFMVALGNVGQQYSSILGSVFSTPPTVYVYSGTAVGILFLKDVPPLPT